MHLKAHRHNHCFTHCLASKHCLGEFWALPSTTQGYGARSKERVAFERALDHVADVRNRAVLAEVCYLLQHEEPQLEQVAARFHEL